MKPEQILLIDIESHSHSKYVTNLVHSFQELFQIKNKQSNNISIIELYIKEAFLLIDSPDAFVQKVLIQIDSYHKTKSYEEEFQLYFHIFTTILEYGTFSGQIPKVWQDSAGKHPGSILSHFFGSNKQYLIPDNLTNFSSSFPGYVDSKYFSFEQFKILALDFLKKCEDLLYNEYGIPFLEAIWPLIQKELTFQSFHETFNNRKTTIYDYSDPNSHSHSTNSYYYYVRFFGTLTYNDNNKSFIYRSNLKDEHDFLKEIKSHYSTGLGEAKPHISIDKNTVDFYNLNPNFSYIFIRTIDPVYQSQHAYAKTDFERTRNLQTFSYIGYLPNVSDESRGNEQKEQQETSTNILLKPGIKFQLITEYSFPSIFVRNPVIQNQITTKNFSSIKISLHYLKKTNFQLQASNAIMDHLRMIDILTKCFKIDQDKGPLLIAQTFFW